MTTFKENLQKRIEEGAIKSELNGETVYLKKSRMPLIGDWGRIYPPINENGSINWLNLIFGGKKNFIKLLIVFAIIIMVLWQFKIFIDHIQYLQDMPCVQNCLRNIIVQPETFITP